MHILYVLVFQGWHDKAPEAQWLKQQKYIGSQIWRQEVEGQVFARLVSSEGCEE